ncbi:hypothetical protein [[Eubacterium] hominis]|uniref:hypothetical protein n=1 Tax=[Eubacterium] hominis TaxID=2764325 RepID=UPI003A4E3166
MCLIQSLIRDYLVCYQQRNNCSKVIVGNIRRNLLSFFSWLEEENHSLKSPVRRIDKTKTKKVVKEVNSDEHFEIGRITKYYHLKLIDYYLA